MVGTVSAGMYKSGVSSSSSSLSGDGAAFDGRGGSGASPDRSATGFDKGDEGNEDVEG